MEGKRVDKELAKEFSLMALDYLKNAKYNSLISFQFNFMSLLVVQYINFYR
jgi:hypothetical protein